MSHNQEKFEAKGGDKISANQVSTIEASSLRRVGSRTTVHFRIVKNEFVNADSKKRAHHSVKNQTILISSGHAHHRTLNSDVSVEFYQTLDDQISRNNLCIQCIRE